MCLYSDVEKQLIRDEALMVGLFPKKVENDSRSYILLRYTLKADGQRPQLTSHHCGASRFGYNFDYRSNPPFQTCIPRLLLRFAQQQSRAGLATPQS